MPIRFASKQNFKTELLPGGLKRAGAHLTVRQRQPKKHAGGGPRERAQANNNAAVVPVAQQARDRAEQALRRGKERCQQLLSCCATSQAPNFPPRTHRAAGRQRQAG